MKERPSKMNILKIIDLNKQIVDLFPEGDSMRTMYEKMAKRLQDRYDTYEQFYINPYSAHTSTFSYHGDKDINDYGGDYISGLKEN